MRNKLTRRVGLSQSDRDTDCALVELFIKVHLFIYEHFPVTGRTDHKVSFPY